MLECKNVHLAMHTIHHLGTLHMLRSFKKSWHLLLSQKCSNAKNGFHTFESMHCICNGHSASHSFSKSEMWQRKAGLNTLAKMWHILVNVTSRYCYMYRTVKELAVHTGICGSILLWTLWYVLETCLIAAKWVPHHLRGVGKYEL